MDPEPWFRDELAKLERQWRSLGSAEQFLKAFRLCTSNDRPLPDWLVEDAYKLLAVALIKRLRKDAADEKHQRRWNMANLGRRIGLRGLRRMGYKPTTGVASAAEVFASDHLRKIDPNATPTQVRESYKMVQAAIRAGDLQDSIGGVAVKLPRRTRVAKRKK